MSKMPPVNEHAGRKMSAGIDHSRMRNESSSMKMNEHNRHAMMIADFKKRFYVVLALT